MGPPPIAPRGRATLALSILGLVAAYFVAGKFGLSLALVNTSTTPVWPPTGIALAALLVLGMRVWPGILAGALLVNLTTTGEVFSSVGIAIGNTLEAVIGAHLVNTFAKGARAFERPQDLLKFAFFAAVLSTVVSATIGTSALTLAGLANLADFGAIWLTWWLGDAAGALIVAPALITWAVARDVWSILSRPLERLLLFAAVIFSGLLLFGGLQDVSVNREPVAFLLFPVLFWAAYRFGPQGSAWAVLLLAMLADWGTIHGFGPFARADQNQSLLLLQAFLGVAAVTSGTLAAAVLDRERAQEVVRATERKLRLVAEESARVRDEFLSVATHELRTPLTGLRGYVQLAQQSLDRGQQDRVRAALATALRQSDRLASLIAQLLDASQVHAGRLTIDPTPTDASALTRDVVEAEQLASATHRWVVDIAPDIHVNIDPIRFEQVLANLLDNAVKFTPAGGTITVGLRQDGADLRLEVSDQGIGIPKDKAERIFERFYRAHDDRGLGGLGLGLYIAREILELHGGRIAVRSEPGRGTTFTVTVPRIDARVVDAVEEPAPRARPQGGRVLVVDDDADIRSLVSEVLRDAGLSVTTAADGSEALAEAARVKPDVVILDKLMPGMDGTAFAAAYRATARAAPIIAFCAARDAPEWAASIGAVTYIGKPFDVNELERLVLAQLPATA